MSDDKAVTDVIIERYALHLLNGNSINNTPILVGTIFHYMTAVNDYYKTNRRHPPFDRKGDTNANKLLNKQKEYEDVAADLSYRPADAALQELKRSSHCDSDGSEPMDVFESSSLGGGDRQKRAIGRATVRMLGSAAWQAGGHWRQASTAQFGWLQKAVATGTKEGSLSPLFDGAAWVGALEEQLASAWARQPQ